MPRITGFDVHDVRFPTSRGHHGSDAVNTDPDYSAAYLVLHTDDQRLTGHGFVFTNGRGNDVQLAAVRAVAPAVVGRDVDELAAGMGDLGRALTRDPQLRWLGPESGVLRMAQGCVVNACWDLLARYWGKPLWQALADLSPEQLVDLVDFRYIDDALTPAEALEILRAAQPNRAANQKALRENGVPAYTTTPGWLGYDDATMVRRCHEAVAAGFTLVKFKVGASLDDDRRRLRLAREALGPGVRLAIDANQAWGVGQAVDWIAALGAPDLTWVEEPTSPTDVLGHAEIARRIAPVRVAAGEQVPNRVVFKQLLQAGGLGVMQVDFTRVGGVNENVANILLARKFGVPVCPHAGGVGLCEVVQHLAMFDAVAVSGPHADRVVEYVDHLHEHFVDPVDVRGATYHVPVAPGSGAELRPQSIAEYSYPGGPVWAAALAG